MSARNVERVGAPRHGKHRGRPTLEQRFRITETSAAAVADVIATKPLIGPHSVFGAQPQAQSEEGDERLVRRFSPAPGFGFDVAIRSVTPTSFVVRFAQPERRVPYLCGEFLWTLSDEEGAAIFDEQINTEQALTAVAAPLDGPRPSLRRFLFFRAGHARVMQDALNRVVTLL